MSARSAQYAALAAIGAAMLALAWSLRAPASAPEKPVVAEPPVAAAVPSSAPAEDRLYQASAQHEVSDTEALDWLMGMLDESKKDPAAAEKAAEFRKAVLREPALKAKLEDFKRFPPARREEAKRFLAAFSKLPEFRQLVARFSAQAQTSARGAAPEPPGMQFAREHFAAAYAAHARAQGPASAVSASGAAGERRLTAVDRVGGAGRAVAAADARSGTRLPGGGTATHAAEAGHAGASGGSSPGVSPGAGAHDVAVKLNKDFEDKVIDQRKEDKVKKLLQLKPCLKNVGQENLERLADSGVIEKNGLWGGCFELRIYGTCKASGCTDERAQGCWNACLDYRPGEDRPCIALVRGQPGCSKADVPAEIWDQYCVAKFDAKGNQLNPPVPYPECGMGSGGTGGGGNNAAPAKPCEKKVVALSYHMDNPPRDGLCAVELSETVRVVQGLAPRGEPAGIPWWTTENGCFVEVNLVQRDGCYVLSRTGNTLDCAR